MKRPLSLCVFLLVVLSAFGQGRGAFSVSAFPTVDFPLGPEFDGVPYYGIGGGASLRADYSMPFAPTLFTGIAADVDLAPMNSAGSAATFLSVGPQLGARLKLAPRISLSLAGGGGLYAGIIDAGTVRNPFASGSLDLSYSLGPSMSLGLGGSYKALFSPGGLAYSGIGASLGLRWRLGGGVRSFLRVSPSIEPIFPLFYSYYDKHPVGSATIVNQGPDSLEDLSVSFFVQQFMEQPKPSWSAERLKPGESVEAPLLALFKDSIFGVTEGTKVAGEVVVSFSRLGRAETARFPLTVAVNNRNGLTWDDTRKVAAFVTAKDPNVRAFALRLAADARSRGKPILGASFRTAVALLGAINLHGVGYVADPSTSFAERVGNKGEVDFVQFPAQTLAYRGGDCDDLSVLYAALLEAAGAQAAFVTTPGHIFVALDLDVDAAGAKALFSEDDLILRPDGAWMPVEVTRLKDGFYRAWKTGAQEWRSAQGSGNAGFYPIREAWATYEPANAGELVREAIAPPDPAKVYAAYSAEIDRIVAGELAPRAAKIQAEVKAGGGSKSQNKLGVLYARFGMLPEAKAQFEAAAKRGDDAAPLVNLGNLAYLGGKYQEAYDYYGKALGKKADSALALLGLVRAGSELGKADETARALERLRKVAPATAANLPQAGEGRAAAADKEVSEWSAED
jgi:hypothetical protein